VLHFIWFATALALSVGQITFAQELDEQDSANKHWGLSLTNDFATRYTSRGFTDIAGHANQHEATLYVQIGDHLSLQGIGFLNFNQNLNKISEIDANVEITTYWASLETTIGYGSYWFPEIVGIQEDEEKAQEIFLYLYSGWRLNPSIFIGYDFGGGSGWYFESSIGYDLDLEPIGLPAELYFEAGLGGNQNYYWNGSGITHGTLNASLFIPLNQYADFRFELAYQEPLSTAFEKNLLSTRELFGGMGIDFDF